jgi:HEAT repeat protein
MGLIATAGCANKFRDRKPSMMLTRSDVDHYVAVATNDPSADERRSAVNRLGESKQLTEPLVIETLINVATHDAREPVRSAAMLVLDQSQSSEACETALGILETDAGNKLPADNAAVRSIALKTIRHCVDEDRAAVEQLTTSVKLAGLVIENDRSRHVRLEAVRMLGCFPERQSLDVLISALSQRDFGICYEAEKSLNRLTGESYDCNAEDWRNFVSGAADPFANALTDAPQQTSAKRSWFDWKK